MRVYAAYNIKGGVGKTATAVNLAFESARTGARTLVWDLDPQGAATFYFRVRPKVRGGAQRLLGRKGDLLEAVRGTDFADLDLLPADFSYRHLDLELEAAKRPERRIKKLLSSVAGEYDVVILDCAPSISLASESIFEAADVLLAPTIPTTLSLRTLAQLLKHLKSRDGHRPRVLPFFCMVDRRKNLHRGVIDWVAERDLGFLATQIPYSSVVERMGVRRAPIGAWSPGSPPARAYAELWREVRATDGGRGPSYATKALKGVLRGTELPGARNGRHPGQATDRLGHGDAAEASVQGK